MSFFLVEMSPASEKPGLGASERRALMYVFGPVHFELRPILRA